MPGGINVTTQDGTGIQLITVQIPGIAGTSGPKGDRGDPGQANVLTIGTVSTIAPGGNATATITGVSPNQVLNIGIPRGATGAVGPANTLSIGTVTTVDAVTGGSATITGTAPNQTLNLTLPRGYGVIPAGTTGEVLVKASDEDYDTGWAPTDTSASSNTIVVRDANGNIQGQRVYGYNQPPVDDEELVSKIYADTRDASDLAEAKAYADTKVSKTGPATIDDSAGGTNDTVLLLKGPAAFTGPFLALNMDGSDYLTVGLTPDGRNEPVLYNPVTGTTNQAVHLANANGSLRILPYNDGNVYIQSTLSKMTFSGLDGVLGEGLNFHYGTTTFDGSVAVAGKVTNVTDPTNAQDAATKAYADTQDAATLTNANTHADTKASIAGDLGGTAASPQVINGAHHTHTSSQVSDAASAPTASKVIVRDANGRAQVVDPSVAADIATKNYVDTVASRGTWTTWVNASYTWTVPVSGTPSALPPLQASTNGSSATDASFTVTVPSGRTLDVELTIPFVSLSAAATARVRLFASTGAIMDGAVVSTGGSQGHAWNLQIKGSIVGTGAAVTITPQGWAAAGTTTLGADPTSGSPARLRYRML